jgi:hypothetical protein
MILMKFGRAHGMGGLALLHFDTRSTILAQHFMELDTSYCFWRSMALLDLIRCTHVVREIYFRQDEQAAPALLR